MKCENFDLKEQYEQEVKPLLNALYEKCEQLGMPMHVVFCTASDGERARIVSSRLFPENREPAPLAAHAVISANPEYIPVILTSAGHKCQCPKCTAKRSGEATRQEPVH